MLSSRLITRTARLTLGVGIACTNATPEAGARGMALRVAGFDAARLITLGDGPLNPIDIGGVSDSAAGTDRALTRPTFHGFPSDEFEELRVADGDVYGRAGDGDVHAVPAPGSVALTTIGLCLLAGRGRRRDT
ncbi:MAG: hypothetical protein RLN60_01870 [Phycisphaerales bacterium]